MNLGPEPEFQISIFSRSHTVYAIRHLQNRGVAMKNAGRIAALALLVAAAYVFQTRAQETKGTARPSDQEEQQTAGTMRPVIRGTHAAVSSMKPEATRAGENILRAGGNAFDAVVAGQAVLPPDPCSACPGRQ